MFNNIQFMTIVPFTDDLEEFHRSWLARDSECQIEESRLSEKKNYRVIENEERDQKYNAEEKYEDRNQETVGESVHTKIEKLILFSSFNNDYH